MMYNDWPPNHGTRKFSSITMWYNDRGGYKGVTGWVWV